MTERTDKDANTSTTHKTIGKKPTTKKATPKKSSSKKATAAKKPANADAKQSPDPKPYLFKPGQSGNPKGKKPGTRNKMTKQIMDLFDADGEEVAKKIIERAKGGSIEAAKIVLDRISPVPKTPRIDPGSIAKIDPANMVGAHDVVIRALVDGTLDAEQANAVTTQLEARRKTVEMTELRAEMAEMKALLQAHQERFANAL